MPQADSTHHAIAWLPTPIFLVILIIRQYYLALLVYSCINIVHYAAVVKRESGENPELTRSGKGKRTRQVNQTFGLQALYKAYGKPSM